MDSPFFTAILVFLSIYIFWFLVRLFADFFLVGIAVTSAVLTYNIPKYYSVIYMILEESNLLKTLNLTLPQGQANGDAIFIIASLIVVIAVLISIPFLPFSNTYRLLFGVEGPLFKQKQEAKIKKWIEEEIQHSQHQLHHNLKHNANIERN